MEAKIFLLLIIATSLSNVSSFNMTRLTDECLKGLMLSETENLKCETEKGVSIQMIKRRWQTFYCVKYEKKTGNLNMYDLLSFDLKEDYELKFTGANVVSNDELNPQFKLYDTRSKNYYRGKFAFSSENEDFDIFGVSINDEEQTCQVKKKKIWPVLTQTIESSTTRIPLTTTLRNYAQAPKVEIASENPCGMIKRIAHFDNFLALPSLPGQFPWTVAIFRYFDEEEESYYKCSGTIISASTVLTSANCLLEDGLLLNNDDLQVHVSPYSLSAKRNPLKIYSVARLTVHEYFNFNLEHNIAAVTLNKDISFNDYVQPICLPEKNKLALGRLGKFAGFGKSSSMHPPKTDILTEAEYQIKTLDPQTFDSENTSGNSRISDIGGGFFVNETNLWTLGGILSRKARNENLAVFTRIDFYLEWIVENRN